ncbi:MAG: hypothetical protein R3F62_10815 [Planctomycetota bacterium]
MIPLTLGALSALALCALAHQRGVSLSGEIAARAVYVNGTRGKSKRHA